MGRAQHSSGAGPASPVLREGAVNDRCPANSHGHSGARAGLKKHHAPATEPTPQQVLTKICWMSDRCASSLRVTWGCSPRRCLRRHCWDARSRFQAAVIFGKEQN